MPKRIFVQRDPAKIPRGGRMMFEVRDERGNQIGPPHPSRLEAQKSARDYAAATGAKYVKGWRPQGMPTKPDGSKLTTTRTGTAGQRYRPRRRK